MTADKDFFRWQVKHGRLKGDPAVLIERARSADVYRPTYADEAARRGTDSTNHADRPPVTLDIYKKMPILQGFL